MIIIMKPHADEDAVDGILASIAAIGLQSHVSRGTERTLIGVIGDERILQTSLFDSLPGVDRVLRVLDGYRLVSREFQTDNTCVRIGHAVFGGVDLQIILSSVSDEPADVKALCAIAKARGLAALNGASFFQNDNPYGKSGGGLQALHALAEQANAMSLPWLTPLQDVRLLDDYLEAAPDAIMLCGKSAADPVLLKELGRINKPVILARPPRAGMAEWLMAAEHLAIGGNSRIILCEQAEQNESAGKGLPLISELPLLKRESHLPVLLAPCAPAITADIATTLALSGVVAGADGLLLDTSRRAGTHALDLDTLDLLLVQVRSLGSLLTR